VHIAAALVCSVELAIGWHHRGRFVVTSALVTLAITWGLYAIAGHRRAHPRRVVALAIPFGTALGLLPLGLSVLLRDVARFVPLLGRDTVVTLVYAFAGALLYGVFLALCALGGLEMQQVFTVLGHPGFKHFVRMRVSPDGTVDAWVIGKDDPLAREGPWLVDRWRW
jgi:Ca2+/Na+ antiporter